MSELMVRLRQEAKKQVDGEVSTRTRYSAEFRSQVLAVAREQQSRGWSVSRIARELGLKAKTVSLWLEPPVRVAVRRVAVAPESVQAQQYSPLVVTAGSLRVEGLDFEGVVRLLRALS